ncbi:MAG TPA: LuxR C-terminal-related transcriptional regulator [Thermoanaerobaculia bacterium]
MNFAKSRNRRDSLTLVVPVPPSPEEVLPSRSRMAWRRISPIEPKPELKLTARESEVLSCFAQGLGTDTIAGRLSISRTTVRNHTQRILAKLGVHTRLAAVARGYETGLIAVPGRT